MTTLTDEHPTDRRARPDALVRHARPSVGSVPTWSARAARSVVLALLGRLRRDRLELVETDGTMHVFGDPRADLVASVVVTDPRAWWALATEGSIGLGRGYIEGWWDSDDPTTVVRVAARNMESLDELRNRLSRRTGPVTDRLRRILPRRHAHHDREDIASHYDIGNEFFELFLDETLTYSSAVFPSAEAALADASRHKYDRLLTKLGIGEQHRVLEIGTGWGGFALRAVDRTGCSITTTTISPAQYDEASKRVGKAGITERVRLLDTDWRDLDGRFDRVVSIEMIEAVDWRDYERFFATIERCLEPDGMVGLQAICVPDRRYERAKHTEDFIRRFVFPGGQLPSIGAISRATSRATRLQLFDVEDLSIHYAETLRRWRERFDERLEEIRALGLDDRFCRLWRFYLAYCEAGFLERHCTVHQLVLVGPDWRPAGLEPTRH